MSSGSAKARRRVGVKRKRDGMDPAGSDAAEPPLSVEQEVLAAFEELHAAATKHVADIELKPIARCLERLVSLTETHEHVCAGVVDSESNLDLLVQLLGPSWYAETSKEEAGLPDACMTSVCQILAELAGVENFRQSLPLSYHKDFLTRLVALLQPDRAGRRRAPAWRLAAYDAAAGKAASQQASLLVEACEAISSVAREHKDAKKLVCDLHGIPCLVQLLDDVEPRLQRAAASVLRTLAFKDEAAKQEIIDAGAMPPLIRMLRSECHQTHYEAVGTLGNLVHSSPDIKRAVLAAGVLQPVINLLNCSCRDSLREAALLIGQFAQCEPRRPMDEPMGRRREDDFRIKIVQRGAVQPLIAMLKMHDKALREMAAFALGRLAQNSDNQAGIFAMGVLPPLLELLASRVRNLEHNAAFTLYGLADNPDNVPEIIKVGGYEQLRQTDFPDEQPTKDCITKTLKRIAEKVQGSAEIKEHLMTLLHSKTLTMRRCMATSLAHLLQPDDIATAYAEHGGAAVLLDVVCNADMAASEQWEAAMSALREVVLVAKKRAKDASSAFVPDAPEKTVIIGKGYVNNAKMHDVIFIVEGEPFYAHKLALAASSEALSAMFESCCREGDAASGVPTITIPHISRAVFRAMMLFIYTGDPSAADDVVQGDDGAPGALAPALLQAADQYLLDKLKVKCAADLARTLTVENVRGQFELATRYNAPTLAHAAVAFCVIEHAELEANDAAGRAGSVEQLAHMRAILEEYLALHLGEAGIPHCEIRPADLPAAVKGQLAARIAADPELAAALSG